MKPYRRLQVKNIKMLGERRPPQTRWRRVGGPKAISRRGRFTGYACGMRSVPD